MKKPPDDGSPPPVPAVLVPGSPQARGGAPATRAVDLPALAESLGLAIVDIDFDEAHAPRTDALRLIPRELAEKLHCVPIRVEDDGAIVIAVGRPWEESAIQVEPDVRFHTGRSVRLVIADEAAVERAIQEHYGFLESADALGSFAQRITVLGEKDSDDDAARLKKEGQRADVIEFVDGKILPAAVKMRASDVYIDPQEKECVVRFRIDGALREVITFPVRMREAVVSRIKILSNLDITERRLPQDGRIRVNLNGNHEVDFRVAIMPVLHGEKVTLRVLDQSSQRLELVQLGFSDKEMEAVQAALGAPHGMILCTGPTGSGKTTTLSAMLSHLNNGARNIMTIEDPVEIPIPGISQSSVNAQIQFSFAAALRGFLRSDPNVIMVGEIRDFETAEIAVKAALTGHLLLSTLHTNDAAAAIARLVFMGVEHYLLADSLRLVIAQRLVRRICDRCPTEADAVTPQELLTLGFAREDIIGLKPMRSVPSKTCRNCQGSGYRGRQAIYEMIPMSAELKRAIQEHSSGTDLNALARKHGMRTLRQAGLALVRAGTTTVSSAMRVTTE